MLAAAVIVAMLSTGPSSTEVTVQCQGFAYDLARQLIEVKQAGLSKGQAIQAAQEWAAEQKVEREAVQVILGMIEAIYDGRGREAAVTAFVKRCVRDNSGGVAI